MSEPRKGWTVSLQRAENSRIPQSVLSAVRRQMEEMGRALALIDRHDPFWVSLRESGLRIDVEGLRFTFRVEPEALVLEEVDHALL